MFADNRYADIGKKCRYADIADTDINIGTSLLLEISVYSHSQKKQLSPLYIIISVTFLLIFTWAVVEWAGFLLKGWFYPHVMYKLRRLCTNLMQIHRIWEKWLNPDLNPNPDLDLPAIASWDVGEPIASESVPLKVHSPSHPYVDVSLSLW